jgi:SAM-dependent methyltransferase
MTLAVLQSRSDISRARDELRRRRVSALPGFFTRVGRRLRVTRRILVGDELKSWDILRTASFLEERIPHESAVLDIGAYASEILCVLHSLGFKNLTGIDLNPDTVRMPHADSIRYEVGDFLHTPFADASFDAITAVSVIEHGFNAEALLSEMSRLLRDDGYFIASFDYWPEKLDTTGQQAFGMDWRIFSRQEVNAFVQRARNFGLEPIGPLMFDAKEPVIHWSGRQYSFAWLALRRRAHQTTLGA